MMMCGGRENVREKGLIGEGGTQGGASTCALWMLYVERCVLCGESDFKRRKNGRYHGLSTATFSSTSTMEASSTARSESSSCSMSMPPSRVLHP